MNRYNTTAIITCMIFMPLFAYAWDLGETGTYHFEAINQQVYVMHGPLEEPNKKNQGFMNNPAIIVSKTGIIVIDPGSSHLVGKQVLAEIKKVSSLPVVAVFNTHIHGDHWLANQALREAYPEANIYAHPKMIEQANGEQGIIWLESMERMTEGLSRGTQVIAPEHAVIQDNIITVAGAHFRIHAMIPTHTDTDIMIEHVETKTLFLGDNCFYQRLGRFDTTASIHGNIAALEYANKLKMAYYVPGHGQSGSAESAMLPFLHYLQKLKQVVKAGFEADLSDYEIKAKSAQQFDAWRNWSGFDVNFGRHINKMYLEIESLEGF